MAEPFLLGTGESATATSNSLPERPTAEEWLGLRVLDDACARHSGIAFVQKVVVRCNLKVDEDKCL